MKFALAAVLLLGGLMQSQEPKPLTLKSRIEFANVEGRIDHFSADINGQRLFMAALGNHTVEVMDVQNGKRLHTIRDLAEPQGLYFDPATNHLFAGCAKDGTTKVFDGSTFQLLETVQFLSNVDNIRYDARNRRIIVGYDDGALGFLDPNGKKMGEIALDAHPESFQLEKSGTRVFVNVPNSKRNPGSGPGKRRPHCEVARPVGSSKLPDGSG
jgi:DNA-binding beta-propeller fold protein YncE